VIDGVREMQRLCSSGAAGSEPLYLTGMCSRTGRNMRMHDSKSLGRYDVLVNGVHA